MREALRRPARVALVLVLALGSVAAGTCPGAQLVLDITPGEDHRVTGPRDLVQVGDRAFFVLGTRETGDELWVTDGSAAGTHRVVDLAPGPASILVSYDETIQDFEGRALFLADVPAFGVGLWLSDGTAAGTQRVDTPPVSRLPAPRSRMPPFLGAGGRIFFVARDALGDDRLWASDGVPGRPATLLHPEMEPLDPPVALPDGRVLIRGRDAAAGQEPWVSDGTPAGTELVVDLLPGPYGSIYSTRSAFVAFDGGALFFARLDPLATDSLWFTDGSESGTRLVFDPGPVAEPLQGGSIVATASYALFEMYDPSLDRYRTWRTDGTPAGTAGFEPSDGRPADGFATSSGHVIYYNYPRGISVTDGTFAGSGRLTGQTSSLHAAFSVGSRFVFKTGAQTGLVWGSDGTEAGTQALVSTSDHGLYLFDDEVWFPREDQPWISDGTPSGTRRFIEVESNHTDSFIEQLTSQGEAAAFTVRAFRVHADGLWRSDGTPDGTFQLHDAAARYVLGSAGGRILYTTDEGLWSTDTTPGSPRFLEGLTVEPFFQISPHEAPLWAGLDDAIVFRGRQFGSFSAGSEPWVSDGTPEGTRLLADVWPGAGYSSPSRFQRSGGRILFFAHSYSSFDWDLWETDGTPEGTRRLAALGEQVVMSRPTWAPEAVVAGGVLYFTACSDEAGAEVFRFDSETGLAVLVADLQPPFLNECIYFGYSTFPDEDLPPSPRLISRVGDRLFFTVRTEVGDEPWVSDGSEAGTFLLRDIRPGSASSLRVSSQYQWPEAQPVGDRVFFVADDGVHGEELWVSDGSYAGTRLVDVWPGPAGSSPRSLQEVEGRLLFFATTEAGDGLFTSDGTHGGTRRLTDEAPAPGLDRVQLAAVGDRVLFPAVTDEVGGELYVADLPPRPGDLDGDGDVDRDDVAILLADRGRAVGSSTCGASCDLDGDGVITGLDARKLALLCTRPGCAAE